MFMAASSAKRYRNTKGIVTHTTWDPSLQARQNICCRARIFPFPPCGICCTHAHMTSTQQSLTVTRLTHAYVPDRCTRRTPDSIAATPPFSSHTSTSLSPSLSTPAPPPFSHTSSGASRVVAMSVPHFLHTSAVVMSEQVRRRSLSRKDAPCDNSPSRSISLQGRTRGEQKGEKQEGEGGRERGEGERGEGRGERGKGEMELSV
jgi:hypothetical protein